MSDGGVAVAERLGGDAALLPAAAVLCSAAGQSPKAWLQG